MNFVKRETDRRELNYFIQLNLGSEDQKGGLEYQRLKSFYDHCINELNLSNIRINGYTT